MKDLRSDLVSYATIQNLETYARTTDLESYARTADLVHIYVKKADYDSLKKEIKDLKE